MTMQANNKNLELMVLAGQLCL